MSQNWAVQEIIPGSTAPATDITKLTDALASLKSHFSGASLPTANLVAGMYGIDTANDLYVRNSANSAWVLIGNINSIRLGAAALAGSAAQTFAVADPSVATHAVRADRIQNQFVTAFTTGGSGSVFTLTPAPAIAGNVPNLRFNAILHADPSGSPTMAVSGFAAGGFKYKNSLGLKVFVNSTVARVGSQCDIQFDGTDWVLLNLPQNMGFLRGYLGGCTLTNASPASIYINVSAGIAADSTNVSMMEFVGLGKSTGSWAVGAGVGGLDTGAIAASTWYHFFVIQRVDTGVVDLLFSLSATAPTMPASYTLKRRIGSCKTDGSSNWTMIIQDGDSFTLDVAVLDIDVTNPGTAAVTRTLASVPTGVNVIAYFNAMVTNESGVADGFTLFSDLAITDAAASTTAAPLAGLGEAGTYVLRLFGSYSLRTNTSAQIRTRAGGSSAGTGLKIATTGWIDSRGRNA